MHREIAELKEIVKEKGSLQLAVMVPDPGKVDKARSLGLTLHELIEFIQITGQCSSRHLTFSEKESLIDE
jgi:hypothetical protein